MDWNDGYVADIAYPAAFFPEQSPTHLSIACVLNGVEPVPLDRPFTYFELGAGMGLTASVLAASHPHGRFYANDFQPAHVASARALAEAGELDNLTLLECSFADLAAGKIDLPPLDFITMYGVYSWVTPENRRHVVDFIARYLKPGGIVYVNYNAMPGWAGALPLQRIVLEHAARHPAGRERQVAQARDFVNALIATGIRYFDDNPALRHRLDSLAAALDVPLAQAARLAALLASSGHATLFLLDGALTDARPARALNRTIARDAVHGDQYQVLASPVLGGGLRAGLVQRLIYTVLTDRPDVSDSDTVLAAVRQKLERYRDAAGCDSSQAAQLAALTAGLPQTVEAILRLRVPVWRALQVL